MFITNSRYFDFCSPIAGILFALAFAPFNYSYLSLVGLAFLFLSWQQVSAKRSLLRGYLFGLGCFGVGVSWVYVSIHDYGGGGVVGSCLLTGLFVGFWALFPALAAWLSVKSSKNYPVCWLLTTPLSWELIEYMRGNLVLNGFPWLLSAYAHLETPMAGYIPLLGAYGTGFLIAFNAASLAYMVCSKNRRGILVGLLAGLWAGGLGLQSSHWTQPIGPPIKAAMIQGNISQDQKWRPENRLGTLSNYQTLTEANWDAQIIIWPESAIPAYLEEVYQGFLFPLHQAAQNHHTDLIVSVPIHEQATNKKYNAVLSLGEHQGLYRKTHLLPFGEYLPLQPVSGMVLAMFNLRLGIFEPGDSQQALLTAAGYPFVTSICYEDAFPKPVPPTAAYLVNVTNDAWFGASIEPHQHLQIARMRALESGRFLLRSTNTGITAIIGADGKVTNLAPMFINTVLTGSVIPMAGSTPYTKLGDQRIILMLAFAYLLLLSLQLLSKPAQNS